MTICVEVAIHFLKQEIELIQATVKSKNESSFYNNQFWQTRNVSLSNHKYRNLIELSIQIASLSGHHGEDKGFVIRVIECFNDCQTKMAQACRLADEKKGSTETALSSLLERFDRFYCEMRNWKLADLQHNNSDPVNILRFHIAMNLAEYFSSSIIKHDLFKKDVISRINDCIQLTDMLNGPEPHLSACRAKLVMTYA